MMATYNNDAHPLPSAPLGGASMLPPQPRPSQHQPAASANSHANVNRQHSAQPSTASATSRPPQSSQKPQNANMGRRSRGMSFRSDKSGSISGKIVPETHAEKESKRLHSKADPTMAINEAEPSAVAHAKSELVPLRSLTHRDALGNLIVDPDRSNPTRHRWERPLDTIRAFEAAIDGAYTRKPSYPETEGAFSRRNSYFSIAPMNNQNQNGNGNGNGYYRNQNTGSTYDLRQGLHGRDSYYEQPHMGMNGRQRYSRVNSESQLHGQQYQGYAGHGYSQSQSVHPSQGHGPGYGPNALVQPPAPPSHGANGAVYPGGNANHRSYETVASSEPAGYQTDPTSSDNSSIERRQSPSKMGMAGPQQGYQRRPSPMNDLHGGYGYNGQSQGAGPSQAPITNANANAPANSGYQYTAYNGPNGPQIQVSQVSAAAANAADGLTMKASAKNVLTRKPTVTSGGAPPPAALPAAAEKRKSWLGRKFSKKN